MIALDAIMIAVRYCTLCNQIGKDQLVNPLHLCDMGRWEPDAQSRLQLAALDLFARRGYDNVTVAEIATAAGLTRRSFFNHFADKREILFAGANAFEESIVNYLRGLGSGDTALNSVVKALTLAGLELEKYRDFAVLRQRLIASNVELRERELVKMDSLARAFTIELTEMDVPKTEALLASQLGISIFNISYDQWVSKAGRDLVMLMNENLAVVAKVFSNLPVQGLAGY